MTKISPMKHGAKERGSKQRTKFVFGLLAIGFGCVIGGIVFLANRNELNQYLGFLATIPFGDKFGHFFLMGILSLLVNLSLLARQIQVGKLKILLGSVIVIALVTAEELSQAFIPSRTLSIFDWLADLAGILIFGQVAIWVVNKRYSVREQHGSRDK